MSQGAAEAGAVKSFGALPLIVLSRAPNRDPDWDRKQTELVRLSSNSQHLFADRSGHNIQLDQPEAAVERDYGDGRARARGVNGGCATMFACAGTVGAMSPGLSGFAGVVDLDDQMLGRA